MDLFSYPYIITGDDVLPVQGNLCSTSRLSKKSRGGYKIFFDKAISNLLHANIDVHNRRLIAELLVDGVKSISKLQLHFANMTFAEKLGMIDFFVELYIKKGS